ncbi:cell division protein FtsX [Clostridium omnivorum]|uniref:Cell division protein FtsX n=2 Tax=Clostridium omnivorum TaxID=1604902 RepID=A0ABQ5N981_9CLOT|nr:cell division protein FtsX [Clostridium sp. E14]
MGIYTEFEIRVDLKADIEVTDYQNIYNKIKAVNYITDITLENNAPMSAAYIIKVNEPDDIPKVISLLNGLQGINKISSGKNIPKKIFAITRAIQWIGAILFLILIAASFFIIKNTIKLALYPRLNEISIMQYLGATNGFIRWSFIFEGIILGFLGAVSAVIALYYLYSFIFSKVASFLETNLISFVSPSFIFTTMSWSFILIGIILSSLGSILVVNKFLTV